jgi:hypothetical protein
LRPQDQRVRQTATPPEAGRENEPDTPGAPEHPAMTRPVHLLLAIGIDGQGPLTSAVELADAARTRSLTTGDAVARVARTTIIRGAAGGFITGVGGFSAMPVALPVNVLEFYVQAARMVSAIATLRGHDVDDPQVRKAVLQTLVRTQRDSLLVKAVSATRGSAVTGRLLRLLPSGALLVGNKGIGYRLLHAIAGRLFARFGRGVPFIGGIFVATTDGWMMRRIAKQAMIDFPTDDSAVPGH